MFSATRVNHSGYGRFVAATSLLFAGCSGPTGPSPSTAATSSVVIKISGVTVVTPGLSTQLVAAVTTSSGASAPANVTWQSQSPGIATVSSTGLVTGVSMGTAVIVATAFGASGQTSIIVQAAGTGTTTITACGTISMPGNYALTSDLQGLGTCLNVSNVASVQLDCHGHAVSGVTLSVVNDASINNCVVTNALVVTGAASVTISHAAIQSQLSITNTSSVEVSDSQITGSGNVVVLVTAATDTALLRDAISNTGNGGASAVGFRNGSNNQLLQSTITGAYDGGPTNAGTDDGIILQNEAGDTLQGNTISGFFDIGIETVDALTNATLADNTFSNIGTGGVGSIYCTNWNSNVVRANRTANVPTLVFVGYQVDTGHCGASAPAGAFVNNQFIGNVFRNPINGTLNRAGSLGSSMFVASGIPTVSGNLLQGNDFASYNGPELNPLSGFIDGGGNVCAAPVAGISNFVCTGGG